MPRNGYADPALDMAPVVLVMYVQIGSLVGYIL